jgi:predicted amidophosphoribosyltransferase
MKTRTCPACGLEETGYFCRHCGTRLTDEEMVRCPHCGRVVPAGGFCNLCGREIPPDAPRPTSPGEGAPDWLRSLGAGSYPPPKREYVQTIRATVIVGIGLLGLLLLGLLVMIMLASQGR